MSEVHRIAGVLRREELTKILDDDVRVVVGLVEPVEVVQVLIVDVVPCKSMFLYKILTTRRQVDVEDRKCGVIPLAHEQEFVATSAPGRLDVDGSRVEEHRRRLNPSKKANLLGRFRRRERRCYRIEFYNKFDHP